MENMLKDLYLLPDINKYEDLHLLTLSSECAVLEEKVYALVNDLPKNKRDIIEAYISLRNDLELETCKAAMRWAKKNLK